MDILIESQMKASFRKRTQKQSFATDFEKFIASFDRYNSYQLVARKMYMAVITDLIDSIAGAFTCRFGQSASMQQESAQAPFA